jgi:CheY-like chemotaxis protein
MKVLIVEDNQSMRHLLSKIVGQWAEVFECTDGSQALLCYEANQPDWVLMDINMKEVNGIEATRRLKAAHKDVRVIMVTNCNDARLREIAKMAGACGYVLKEDLSVLQQLLTTPP